MKKLLLIDCYDSFTDILAQTLEHSGYCKVNIIAWDRLNLMDVRLFDAVVLSPGPGLPHEYPLIFAVLNLLKEKPVLGVCMGHQILGVKCGAELRHLGSVFHGQVAQLKKNGDFDILYGVEDGASLGLYHSWVLENVPPQIKVLAVSEQDRVMIIQHESYPWTGFQFHPESYMTDQGKQLLSNWLQSF